MNILASNQSNLENIETDIKSIYNGIFYLLDKNQNKHFRNLQKIMEYKNNFETMGEKLTDQKKKYKIYLEKLETFLSNLIIELNDCIENNNIVCHTGIFNRLTNSINLLDNEVNIKTYDFLNEEIMNKCIAIRSTLDTNISNYEEELKNKIKIEMNKDYVNTKILTQSQLDDILNIWIDHI
jgi:hypothetical protein